jgi:lipopolysaccharide/colanic/teichoic acid biosynthesis glycosyltransferase
MGLWSRDARVRLDRAAKRVFDVFGAGFLLLVFAPLILVVAAIVRLDTPGPAFYGCRRVGFRGRELRMLKFRKMRQDASGPALTASDDERFTGVGRFLAKSKLDELPQLWNVFKGEMSFVGPRPEDPSFVALRPDDYEEILAVKPGITGLSQLAFAKESEVLDPENTLEDYVDRLFPQKISMDRLYAERRSVWMDLRILVWTAVAVVVGRDVAVHRQSGRLGVRRRPAPELGSVTVTS